MYIYNYIYIYIYILYIYIYIYYMHIIYIYIIYCAVPFHLFGVRPVSLLRVWVSEGLTQANS